MNILMADIMHELIIKTEEKLNDLSQSKNLTYQLLEKTQSILKARLLIEKNAFIQIYVNARKNKISYTLIINNQRTYSKDCIYGVWHMHPFKEPHFHDTSEIGKNPISVTDFVIKALYYYFEINL
ncbi:hypothetical protein MHK_009345 [Candidatus Magnetomorum sp. HK-1]|nr:hypothetical protein MHK_009345 [Candidatus Magnetomorum sp. HK-1]